ncbi:hypothetical protein PG985_004837 [Apiospora marii]|uniref:uncharacterized protein n=1 Tax=Apiospora marii TaxID=335849 RepID=UPI00312EE7E2
MHADDIIVLGKENDGGKFIERGTQEKLLQNNSVYARLWEKHIGALNKIEKKTETKVEDLFESERHLQDHLVA